MNEPCRPLGTRCSGSKALLYWVLLHGQKLATVIGMYGPSPLVCALCRCITILATLHVIWIDAASSCNCHCMDGAWEQNKTGAWEQLDVHLVGRVFIWPKSLFFMWHRWQHNDKTFSRNWKENHQVVLGKLSFVKPAEQARKHITKSKDCMQGAACGQSPPATCKWTYV
jgi:hypothetical protein